MKIYWMFESSTFYLFGIANINIFYINLEGVWFGVLKFNTYCSSFVLFDNYYSIID